MGMYDKMFRKLKFRKAHFQYFAILKGCTFNNPNLRLRLPKVSQRPDLLEFKGARGLNHFGSSSPSNVIGGAKNILAAFMSLMLHDYFFLIKGGLKV